MTREEVTKTLADYRNQKSRRDHLRVKIEELERAISSAFRAYFDALGDVSSSWPDGGVHGSTKKSGIEGAVIRRAEAKEPPEIAEMRAEAEALREELKDCETACRYVEAWLEALNERERWTIERQLIDGETWRRIMDMHEARYGFPLTKDALRRIKCAALDKIMKAAK